MCTLLTHTFCLVCHVQTLELSSNKIANAGLTALAKAVESGALPQLKDLWILKNAPALKAACEARGIAFH